MDKIGLQQSEAIFDCFRDIDVPEVSEYIREKFVPTTLTNAYSDDEEDDDDLSLDEDEDDDIIGLEQDDEEGDEEQEGQEEEQEEEGLRVMDIELVMNQSQCSREQAIKALKENNSDIVSSVLAAAETFNENIRDFNRRDHTFSELIEVWTYYMENGILDTITWPIDHLELAAERYYLDIPDMPRTLQIHLVEQCMKEEIEIGWFKLFRKVITIQRIFRGYRARKPWIDVAFP